MTEYSPPGSTRRLEERLAPLVAYFERRNAEMRREFEARFERLERERRAADPESLFTHHIPRFLPRASDR